MDSSGALYIADQGNHTVRKVSPSGIITTVAGNGTAGYSGDGGPATDAQLQVSFDVEITGAGDLFLPDGIPHGIRRVSPAGIISTVTWGGDGPSGVTCVSSDSSNNLFLSNMYEARIFKLTTTGTMTRVAGNGTLGYSGDGGPALSAQLCYPGGMAVDTSGALYIADRANQVVRKVQ